MVTGSFTASQAFAKSVFSNFETKSSINYFSFYEKQKICLIGEYVPEIKTQSLATIIEDIEIKNKSLINCLIKYESNGNKYAIGLAGEIGILQFKPQTYNYYCIKKFGLSDDIYDEKNQKVCADKMISIGLLHHWTTRFNCI